MRPCALIIPVLGGLAIALPAADIDYTDLRLGAGVLSNEFSGSSTNAITTGGGSVTVSQSTSDSRDSDHNYRAQIQLVHGDLGPIGGAVVGIGIAANQAQWDDGAGHKFDATTPSADLLLGYGFAITRSWHIELTPFAGIGRAYYSHSSGGTITTSDDWDNYYEYGASLGTWFTAPGGLQIGVEVPYLVGRFDAHYSYDQAGNTRTITDQRKNEGFGVLVTIGGRF